MLDTFNINLKALFISSQIYFGKILSYLQSVTQYEQFLDIYPGQKHSWAEKTGPNTCKLIKRILESREYPVQTYRACMGIMRFGKSYSRDIMEAASREALNKNTCSYKYFSMIIKQMTQITVEKDTEKIITHDNVRGSSAFVGGGINA